MPQSLVSSLKWNEPQRITYGVVVLHRGRVLDAKITHKLQP
jgi:hypothetical protein